MSDDLLGDFGGPKLPWWNPSRLKAPGDSVIGIAQRIRRGQQKDFETGKPQFFADGNPIPNFFMVLSLPGDSDGEPVDHNVKLERGAFTATRDALVEAGISKGDQVKGKVFVLKLEEIGERGKKIFAARFADPK